jgi:uncharacterized protein YcbK (DUF882 family)
MVSRLSMALAVLLAASAPASASRVEQRAPSKRPPRRPAPIELVHLNTHETFLLRPDPGGRLDGKRLRGLRHFLRCHHTGREHPMAPRLAQLLYATAHHFEDRPVAVIAGYRAPRVARDKGNPRSPHRQGLACDFRIDGVANTELRDYLRRSFHGVGVGYYPNSGFVHLDVGRRHDAFWIDYSGPGEPARYSPDPEADRSSEAVGAPPEGEAVGDGRAPQRPPSVPSGATALPAIEAAPPATARPSAPGPGQHALVRTGLE